MAEGWVKLYRKFTEWRWYQDANTKSVFIHPLITANYEDKDWHSITIKRGQRVSSYEGLGEELKLSTSKIRTAIDRLKLTGEITSKTTNKYSIITILNYDRYQALSGEVDDEQCDGMASEIAGNIANKSQTNRKQIATTKEVKNKKKDKNNTTTPISPPVAKVQYAENVTLAEQEYNTLIERVGMEGATYCINKVSAYKLSTGKTYKSDYAAILNWGVDRWAEEQARRRKANGASPETHAQMNDRKLRQMLAEEEAKEAAARGNQGRYNQAPDND